MGTSVTEPRVAALTGDDLDSLADIVRVACDLDDLSPAFLRRRLLAKPELDGHLLLGAWLGERLVGVAAGMVRERPSGPTGHIRLLAVHPDWRRRGVAAALLDELESRFAAAGAGLILTGCDTPGYIFPGVEVGYTAALCFLQKRGYAMSHETSNMAVELRGRDFDSAAIERRLLAVGIRVRRLAACDRSAFDAYLAANWSASWRVEAGETLESDPPSGFIALRGEEIIAFAAYNVSRVGWFGPTGTNESERGKGIGTALLLRCMAAMRDDGHERAEIGWTTVWPFYTKVAGARVCRWFWQMEKTVPR